jgi:uncharacterized protein
LWHELASELTSDRRELPSLRLEDALSGPRRALALGLPVVVPAAMYLLFGWTAELFGTGLGYFAGFVAYWLVCGLLPVALLGPRKTAGLFAASRERLGRPAWRGVVCLGLPIVFAYGYAFPGVLPTATPLVVATSAALAAVNGALEELLWRGLFVRAFPQSWLLGWVYPAIGFALWHFAPLRVMPNRNPGGAWSFVAFSFAVGLLFGWVAWRSGSIRWTTIAHVFLDFSGLGGLAYFGIRRE